MKYIVTKAFANWGEGDIIEFKDAVPLAAQCHVKPFKGKKEFAVNPEGLKAEAIAEYKESDEFKQFAVNQEGEALEGLKAIYEKVVGEKPHHATGAKKLTGDIVELITED